MSLHWKIDECGAYSGRMRISGWAFQAAPRIAKNVGDFAASTFQASRNGAQLNLTGNGLDLTTPVGTGVLLDFTDSDRVLTFTGPDMTIGSQTITSTTQFLIA